MTIANIAYIYVFVFGLLIGIGISALFVLIFSRKRNTDQEKEWLSGLRRNRESQSARISAGSARVGISHWPD